jgi:preprotein translocase subunit SecD
VAQAGVTIAPDRVERLVAGDTGALPAGLAGVLRRSVEAGFAHGFLAAGLAAALAGAIVVRCMRPAATR